MSTDTNVVRPKPPRDDFNDPTGTYPTTERKRYRPKHRIPGEITDDITTFRSQGVRAPGERSQRIAMPVPPRSNKGLVDLVNEPRRLHETRVLAAPFRASAPIPEPTPAVSWWQQLVARVKAVRW